MYKFSIRFLFLCAALDLSVYSAPPSTWYWQEHWFEHNQTVRLMFNDGDVGIYYDNDVHKNISWPFGYLGDVWRYTKRVYGSFGQENSLYAIFHAGKYGGGKIYFFLKSC